MGYREQPYRPRRMEEHRVAWVKTAGLELVRYEGTPEDPDDPRIRLVLRTPGRRNELVWRLDAMTGEELAAVTKFLEDSMKVAVPVVERLDKEARDALENGDDSIPRIYRQPPVVVERPRGKPAHVTGLHERPEPAAGLGGDGSARDAGAVRDGGSGLAEREPATEG